MYLFLLLDRRVLCSEDSTLLERNYLCENERYKSAPSSLTKWLPSITVQSSHKISTDYIVTKFKKIIFLGIHLIIHLQNWKIKIVSLMFRFMSEQSELLVCVSDKVVTEFCGTLFFIFNSVWAYKRYINSTFEFATESIIPIYIQFYWQYMRDILNSWLVLNINARIIAVVENRVN